MITQAREYLGSAGFALVKVKKGAKGPIDLGWNQQSKAIVHIDDAEIFADSNVGLLHAWCPSGPTMVLDIDNLAEAHHYFATKGLDLNRYLCASNSVQYSSGKPNRIKLVYRVEQAQPTKKILGDNSQTVVEFRCATKAGLSDQDLLPPSLHPDGYRYQWIRGDFRNLPMLPSELLRIWKQENAKLPLRPVSSGPPKLNESPKNIQDVKDALSKLDANCDRNLWRDIVWGVMSTGWACAYDLALEWSKTGIEKFDQVEFDRVVDTDMGATRTGSQVTLGTVYHHAKQVMK